MPRIPEYVSRLFRRLTIFVASGLAVFVVLVLSDIGFTLGWGYTLYDLKILATIGLGLLAIYVAGRVMEEFTNGPR